MTNRSADRRRRRREEDEALRRDWHEIVERVEARRRARQEWNERSLLRRLFTRYP